MSKCTCSSSLERHQQEPRRCRSRRLASQEHESIGNQESGAKVWAESCHLGCQPVRVAPPTGMQNAVARRSACPGSTTKHQPHVSRVWARIGGEPQVASKVRLRPLWILGPCGFRQCREYQRGGTRLASCSWSSGEVNPSGEPTEGIPALAWNQQEFPPLGL
jgi:hypothetical protein